MAIVNSGVLAGFTLLYLAISADGPNFNVATSTIQDYFSATAAQIQLLTISAQLCVAVFVLAAVLLVSSVIIWFGMNKPAS